MTALLAVWWLFSAVGADAATTPSGDEEAGQAGPSEAPEPVDPSPWLQALGDRFEACLGQELTAMASDAPESPPAQEPPEGAAGAAVEPAPQPTTPGAPGQAAEPAAIEDLIAAVAPLLGRERPGDCTVDAQAVSTCEQQVRAASCEELHDQLDGALRGLPPGGAPPWAEQYGAAIADRVAACFALEQGREATPTERADLDTFGSILAGSLATLGPACAVDEDRHGECLLSASRLPCSQLAEELERDPAQLVQTMMGGCGGFLDCGF